jgi:ketosteroid isomerase-like protein
MRRQANLHLAQQFLKLMSEQAAPEHIATLFSHDVSFEIPGDDTAFPWIGRQTGRSAVIDFVTDLRTLTEPVKFEVTDVLTSDSRAVILVDFTTRIKATGQTIVSSSAIVLEISGAAVTRFLLLEDSFQVSRKARP